MAYKPIDARRDEFRKYLERTGVLDMFTKVLSKLMTETDKPEDAIEFIRANFGDSLNDKDTIVSLNQKLDDANQLIEELRAKLRQYEPMDDQNIDTAAANTTTTTTVTPTPPASVPEAAAQPEPTAAVTSDAAAEPMQVDNATKETEVTTPAPVPATESPATSEAVVVAEDEPKTVVPEGSEPEGAAKTESEEKSSSAESSAAPAAAAANAEAVATTAAATAPEASAAKPEEKMEN